MTLVDRYLNAVRFFLPRQRQDDLARELSENLVSEIEDRSQVLGRDLTEHEIVDILRRHGHPALVAARFAPRQHLIGPFFFPIYVLALKVGLAVALVVTVGVAVISAALRGVSVPVFLDGLLAYPNRALIVFAWTTLAFAALDALGAQGRIDTDWDPRKIPDWMAGGRQPIRLHDRLHALVEVLFGVAALVWLLLVPSSPWLAMGPLANVLAFAPVWRVWYLPLVAVAMANLALDTYRLYQPKPTARRITLKLALLACQVAVSLTILSARVWVVAGPQVRSEIVPANKLPELLNWVNTGVAIGFGVVVIITLVEMGKQYYRLRTLHREQR
jgi:hypothetical protein